MNKFYVTIFLLIGFFSFLIYDTFINSTSNSENKIFAFSESENKRDLLIDDLKKINSLSAQEPKAVHSSAEESSNDLLESVDLIIANGVLSLSPVEIDQLKLDAKKKQSDYQDYINAKWSEAFSQKDLKSLKHLCDLTSLLPMIFPQLQKDSEELLLAYSKGELTWNDELFRSLLQFFLVQSKYSQLETIDFLEQLKQNAKSNQLINNVNSAINAIKI